MPSTESLVCIPKTERQRSCTRDRTSTTDDGTTSRHVKYRNSRTPDLETTGPQSLSTCTKNAWSKWSKHVQLFRERGPPPCTHIIPPSFAFPSFFVQNIAHCFRLCCPSSFTNRYPSSPVGSLRLQEFNFGGWITACLFKRICAGSGGMMRAN